MKYYVEFGAWIYFSNFVIFGMEALAKNLRVLQARMEPRPKNKEIAAAVGISEQNYHSYIREKKPVMPSAEVLTKLADFFGVLIDDLLRPETASTLPIKKHVGEVEDDHVIKISVRSLDPEDRKHLNQILFLFELMSPEAREHLLETAKLTTTRKPL